MSDKPRIADDYEYIAQRLRELEDERSEQRTSRMCERCDNNYGWVWRDQTGHWIRCPMCGNPNREPQPR